MSDAYDWGAWAALELADPERHLEILDALCPPDGIISEGEINAPAARYTQQNAGWVKLPSRWRWYRQSECTAKLQEPIFGAGRGVLRHADLILGFRYIGVWEAVSPETSTGAKDDPGPDMGLRGKAVCLIEPFPIDGRDALKKTQTIRRTIEKAEHDYAVTMRLPSELRPAELIMCVITDVKPGPAVLRALALNRVRCIVMNASSPLSEVTAESEEPE
jgi:hypothetical protein